MNARTFIGKSAPVAVLLFCFCLLFVIWRHEKGHLEDIAKKHAITSSEQIKIRIEGMMNSRMAALKLMAERWIEKTPPDFSKKRFMEFSESCYANFPGFSEINLIEPGGELLWQFSGKRNPGEINNNYFHHPDLQVKDAFIKAVESRQFTTSVCVELLKGETGFETFYPLIYNGNIQSILNGVFHIKKIIDICITDEILNSFFLNIYEDNRLIFTNDNKSRIKQKNRYPASIQQVNFSGKTWRLEMSPDASLLSQSQTHTLLILIYGLIISLGLSLVVFFMIQQIEKFRRARDLTLHEVNERKKSEFALRESEGHVHHLSRQLIEAQEKEREMLSLELHDRIAQDLSLLKITFDTLFDGFPEASDEIKKRVSELSKILQGIIITVRDMSYELIPPGLTDIGFSQAVNSFCEEFSEKTGINVELSHSGIDQLKLDYNTYLNLYRLIQEGLNNIKKHAEARNALVNIVASYPNIILRIEDDGRGFDVEERARHLTQEKRMGLRSMNERVGLLGGSIKIQSHLMKGTKVFIKIPFASPQN